MLSQESDEAIIKRAAKNAIEQSRFPDYDNRLDWDTETTNTWVCPSGLYEVYVMLPGGIICSLKDKKGQTGVLWTNYRTETFIFPASHSIELGVIAGEIGTPGSGDTSLSCISTWYYETLSRGFIISTGLSLTLSAGTATFIFRRVG